MTLRALRPALIGLMAVILAVTSLTMAVARGQTHIAGEIVICTGYGITTISVDENGDPVGPVHLCPDMVLGMMAALEMPAPDLTRPDGPASRLTATETTIPLAQSAPTPRARDPPIPV